VWLNLYLTDAGFVELHHIRSLVCYYGVNFSDTMSHSISICVLLQPSDHQHCWSAVWNGSYCWVFYKYALLLLNSTER